MKRFLQLFLDYGLVGAVLVWAWVVGMMAYRLDESPWRWAFVALSVGGFVTIGGILWIRKYINRLSEETRQERES